MNPFLDQLLVLLLIVAAVGYFVRRMVRTSKKGCDSGCCTGSKWSPPEPTVRPATRGDAASSPPPPNHL
ncbi:MAG TPA: FeoB-associated Cys-rich membrane protein [Chthoniobacteraceae bacterium]|nr:FeoB-associated Cys-rich membrane protein [Chthoniobacteraceae bacterium]